MIIPILQFIQAKGAGNATLRRLLSFAVQNGEESVRNLFASPKILTEELNIKGDIAQNIINASADAHKLCDKILKENINITWQGSKSYPSRLLNALGNDAPPFLFFKGHTDLFYTKGIGFCGSRKASEKGLKITARCAEQLANRNICVVSGYAHGVDMAAHKAALTNGGKTIFVLVEGILRFYRKREIQDLFTQDNFLAVSQFPPNLTWSARNAMKRNGTIIGLSNAMILVESGLTGGTFAAGQETLRRKKPLFVIDYAAPGPSAEANPYFIQHGGIPIRGNADGKPNLTNVFKIIDNRTNSNNIEVELHNTKQLIVTKQGNLL